MTTFDRYAAVTTVLKGGVLGCKPMTGCFGLRPRNDVLVALIFLLSISAAAAQHPASAVKAFNAGVELFNANDCRNAIPKLDEAISADNAFAEAYYARGVCRYRLEAMDGAAMDLGDAIRLDSTLLDARAMRGVLYYDSDRWDDALADFNYVLERRPDEPQSLIGRGVIYLKREQTQEAQVDFRRFLKVRPRDPLAPKIRQLMASLSGERTDAAAESGVDAEPAPKPRRTSAKRREAPVDPKALADSLFKRHAVSERYGRGVLRGESSNAIGDRSDPSAR